MYVTKQITGLRVHSYCLGFSAEVLTRNKCLRDVTTQPGLLSLPPTRDDHQDMANANGVELSDLINELLKKDVESINTGR